MVDLASFPCGQLNFGRNVTVVFTLLTTASCCTEDKCLGYSVASRQYNPLMAGNPCNPTMTPHAVFQEPVELQWRQGGEVGGGGMYD